MNHKKASTANKTFNVKIATTVIVKLILTKDKQTNKFNIII